MSAGEQRKGKYAPLQALIPRIGARQLLHMHPALLKDTLRAMRIPAVCPSAASLLRTLLQHLQNECNAAHPGKLLCLQQRTVDPRQCQMLMVTAHGMPQS